MITVLGSINLDLFAYCPRLPQAGETLIGSRFATAAGGKGANQALAVLRAGGDLRFVGAVGNDDLAEAALAELRDAGADLSAIAKLPGATGTATILVADNGENVIVIAPGANGLISAEMADERLSALAQGDFLLLQQEIPAAANISALHRARKNGARTILNIAPFTPDSAELASMADIVIANETEFAALVGPVSAKDAQTTLSHAARAANRTLIVTLGADGVAAADPAGHFFQVAAPAIVPRDTVGAGDTFCGYLTASFAEGSGFEVALKRAVTAASLACLRPGAQPAIPMASEVNKALQLGA